MKNILTLILAIGFANCMSAQTIEQARNEFQNENYKQAKHTLMALYANSSQAALYLGNTYLKLDEMDSAKIFYSKADAGTDAYAFIAKARLAIMNKNDKATIQSLIDKALSLSKKKDAEVFYQAGFLTYQPKATAVAEYLPYFLEASRLSPNSDFFTLSVGDMYLEQHEGGKAMSQYEMVTDKQPDNLMALIRIGRLFYSSTNYTKAIEFLEKANTINPNYSIVHKELGELYYLTRNYTKATSEFKKYLELNDNDSRAKGTYGGFLYQLKEYQTAVDEVSNYIKQDSTNFIYYRILAYCSYEIKKPKEAQVAMGNFWKYCDKSKLINLDYVYSGRIASANNDTGNAIGYMKRAVEMDSTNAELQSEYAKILYNSKRYKQSIAEYKKRLNMKQMEVPNLDYYYLGRAYFSNAEFVNADTTFAMFVKLQPKTPDGYLWRAKSNLELEDKSNLKGFAVNHYLKYIELASTDVAKNKANLVSAYTYLGFVALAQKDNVKAKEYFNKIVEIDPSNVKAQDEIKRLK